MSDAPSQEQDPTPGAEADERSSSVGLYLAGQRRVRGISVDELSARTRIPRRNIERLEAGAFDAAPDGFSRGFVRTVAIALGLDADEAVTRLMTEPHSDDSLLMRERRANLLLRGVVLVSVVLAGVAGWKLYAALSAPVVSGTAESIVYRRDPVRELAVSESRIRRAAAPEPVAPAPGESD